MNSNAQPPTSAKDLSKQVVPIVKQYVQGQVAARKNRPPQQRKPGILDRLLHPQHNQNQTQNQKSYPPEGSQAAYRQPHRRDQNQNQTTSSQGRQQEIRDCLKAHNEARRQAPGRHRPDLQWDERLARHAQAWADHLLRRNKFEHDTSGTGEGENLYMAWGHGLGKQTFKQAVDSWNGEIVYYSGQKIGSGDMSKYGHYTQNIWPTTTHVGMARARTVNGKQIIVARYSPQGNIRGKSAYE